MSLFGEKSCWIVISDITIFAITLKMIKRPSCFVLLFFVLCLPIKLSEGIRHP